MKTTRRRSWALFVICATIAASTTATTGMVVTLPILALSLGADPAIIGLLAALGAVVPIFLGLPAGSTVDRVGSRRILIGAAATTVVALAVLYALPSLAMIAASHLAIGMCRLLVIVSAQTYTVRSVVADRREAALGWYTMSVSFGMIVGPFLAGAVIQHSQPLDGVAVSITAAILAAICSSLLPEGKTKPTVRSAPARTVALPWRGVEGAGFRSGFVASIVITLVSTVFEVFLPVHLAAAGVSPASIGGIISARAVAAMMIRPFTSQVIRLFGGRPNAVLVTVVCVTAVLAPMGVVTQPLLLVPLVLVLGFAAGIGIPLSIITAVEGISPEVQGRALGQRLVGNHIVMAIAPAVVGSVATAFGFVLAFPLAALVGTLGTVLLVAWRPMFTATEAVRSGAASTTGSLAPDVHDVLAGTPVGQSTNGRNAE